MELCCQNDNRTPAALFNQCLQFLDYYLKMICMLYPIINNPCFKTTAFVIFSSSVFPVTVCGEGDSTITSVLTSVSKLKKEVFA